MTNFRDLTDKKIKKETKFKKLICLGATIDTCISPNIYKYVDFLGTDSTYGSVFKAYDEIGGDFSLYFGEKGGEFD